MKLIYFVLYYYKSMELTLIKPMVSIYLISHYLSLYHSKALGNYFKPRGN